MRDEEDAIADVLRYHHAQGVDFFVVTDNGSKDRTLEVLGRWADAGLLRVIQEPSPKLRDRGHEWVTRMARVAATEHGADWVVHGDADEFWWPHRAPIKDALAAVPAMSTGLSSGREPSSSPGPTGRAAISTASSTARPAR